MSHVLLFLMCVVPVARAADESAANDRARKQLQPRPVKLVDDAMPLDAALKALQEQTGNVIVDGRRLHKGNPKLKLDLRNVTFWQAIDDITTQADCGYSVYQDAEKLVLDDTPRRKLNVAYAGICRIAVKRVSVIRDDESNQRFCDLLLEVAWEPRFQPFFLDVSHVDADLAGYIDAKTRQNLRPRLVKATPPGQFPVGGLGAVEVDVRLPAPDRRCQSIEKLSGKLNFMGPSKMLTFRFADLKPGKVTTATRDDVKVTFQPVVLRPDRWAFKVAIDNPPGGPTLESYKQDAWLVNNRIWLERTDEPKEKLIYPLKDKVNRVALKNNAEHAAFVCTFTENVPARQDGWSVVYRTPGRIVDLPLSFTLKDIPLP